MRPHGVGKSRAKIRRQTDGIDRVTEGLAMRWKVASDDANRMPGSAEQCRKMATDKPVPPEDREIRHGSTSPPDLTKRIPCADGVGWHLTTDHRASANDGSSPKHCSVENDAVGANPDIVLHDNAATARLEALLRDRNGGRSDRVVGRCKCAVGGDEHAVPQGQAVSRVNHSPRIDVTMLADGNVARAACRLDLDEGIDHRMRTDDDPCPSDGILDIRERGNLRGGIDQNHCRRPAIRTSRRNASRTYLSVTKQSDAMAGHKPALRPTVRKMDR